MFAPAVEHDRSEVSSGPTVKLIGLRRLHLSLSSPCNVTMPTG